MEKWKQEMYSQRKYMYEAAAWGLQPLSWDTLLRGSSAGPGLRAWPIEMLAQEQFKDDQELDVGRARLLRAWRSSRTLEEAFQWLREARAMFDAHWERGRRRHYQALHYGMMVCRAFFTSASALVPNKIARVQELATLIGQFITG